MHNSYQFQQYTTLWLLPSLKYLFVAFQSLKSRGYVSEQFAWRHFYWYLTNEGISYLRNYLHLPAEVSQIVVLLCL